MLSQQICDKRKRGDITQQYLVSPTEQTQHSSSFGEERLCQAEVIMKILEQIDIKEQV